MITEQLILNKNTTKETFDTDRKSEKPKRSIVKSVSWRVIGTIDTILISWLVTGTLTVAFSIYQDDLVFFSRTNMEYHKLGKIN